VYAKHLKGIFFELLISNLDYIENGMSQIRPEDEAEINVPYARKQLLIVHVSAALSVTIYTQ